MDSVHLALVKELVQHLCVELDLHYDDSELATSLDSEIQCLREAMALLFIAGAEPPEVYAHLMRRVAAAEQASRADQASRTDQAAHPVDSSEIDDDDTD